MFKTIEKSWPIVSILFALLILASLFFLPGATRFISLAVMTLGLAAIVTFTVRRHVQAHRQGRITRPVMRRNLLIDLTGLLLTMIVVIYVAGLAGAMAGQAAGSAWGPAWAILSGLAVGIGIGFAISVIIRRLWTKLTKLAFRRWEVKKRWIENSPSA